MTGLVTELKGDGKFVGYRANVVTYAIAKLSHATAQRVDLHRIWDEQRLTDAVEAALVELAHVSWKVLVDEAPVGANVTEWAKQERCWRETRNETWSIPPTLDAELVELGVARDTSSGSPVGGDDDPSVRECSAVVPDEWFALANWAKETHSLSSWQRKLAFDIGVRVSRGRPPSQKQARYGSQILKEARDLGFQMTGQAVVGQSAGDR
jgi:hypothetical protein